ncbi:MAG TPA: HlyC/CorC family transporter [Saprospirales bacterium]|nr:HlyC/CorC family transporter [Saprospirales bacterium]HAY70566.1 HlyC/CorC family transporter [Saprospirales bacterium]HRQ29910.1 hemolysin family protein [Saprospiraceae bacterium]
MLLFWILILLFLSAFFSGMEAAFISAAKIRVEILKSDGSVRGRILSSFYENQNRFLLSLQTGNMLTLILLAITGYHYLFPLMELKMATILSILLITLIIGIIVWFFGELMPKLIFSQFANELLYFFTYPLLLFHFLLVIPAWVTEKLSSFVMKYVFRIHCVEDDPGYSRLDLKDYISSQLTEDDEIEKEILENTLDLDTLKVRDCMIPRTEIVGIDIHASRAEILDVFRSTNHSRILVFDGDIENVKGYIHHQHVINDIRSIEETLVEVPFLPETMNIKELLLKMMKDQKKFACVVDEFGSISGLITLEDILEEIFGEIEDEHDDEDLIEQQISDSEFLFSGRMEIAYLNETYEHIHLPEDEYLTLSGYIVMTSGAIPRQGEEIILDNYKFIFEKVSATKIDLIRMIIIDPEQEA